MGDFLGNTPLSRSQRFAINTQGVKYLGGSKDVKQVYRTPELELYDSYYESRQYDGMHPWDIPVDSGAEYIPVRQRKPRIIYAFAKVLVDRVAAKLIGDNVFPKLRIEDSPDDETFIKLVVKAAKLRIYLMEAVKQMLTGGSGFLRFYFVEGKLLLESYQTKYCYPEFQDNGELESVRIQYVYEDQDDRDKDNKPICKWYKLELGMKSDVLYNNPEYKENKKPEFSAVSTTNHNLGFVQGQWLKTTGGKHNSPDGYALISNILDFIDELNYSLSQTSQAVQYNQEPVLTLKGIDEDEMAKLVRSSQKALNLGREGEASFLETSLEGAKQAGEQRKELRLLVQDVARIVFLDPEKMAANAQSGKAMEVMHGPMIELVNELRPMIEEPIIELVSKIAVTMLQLKDKGVEIPVTVPDGYEPQSLDIVAHWPPVFPLTIEDLKNMSGMCVQLAGASIFSRETMTRYLAPHFEIDDIEEELSKIESQPILNPFGGGFMDSPSGGKPPGGK